MSDLQNGQVLIHFILRNMDPVLIPFDLLVFDEFLEDVVAERAPHGRPPQPLTANTIELEEYSHGGMVARFMAGAAISTADSGLSYFAPSTMLAQWISSATGAMSKPKRVEAMCARKLVQEV